MLALRQLLRLPEIPESPTASDGDYTEALAAKALNLVLLGTLAFGALFVAVVVPLYVARKAAAILSWALIIGIAVSCLLLLRRGYVRLSAWILLAVGWLIVAVYVAFSGGTHSPLLLAHLAVVVASAWLLGRGPTIGIAVLSLSFDLSLAILESTGSQLPSYFPLPPMVVWAITVVLLGIAIVPLARVHQALTESARQAQQELEARRHEEHARTESDERFRAAFFQAAVGIVHVGLNGECLLVNDRYLQMLGYTLAEIREKTFLGITHPDDLQEVISGRRRLLAGEISSHTMDKRFLRRDGSICWARLYRSLVRDEENRPKYIIAVVEDINERKQAETALRESEERLRANELQLMDAQRLAKVGSWVRDLGTNTIQWSDEIFRMFGLAKDAPLDRQEFLGLVHPKDLPMILEAGEKILSGAAPVEVEYRIVRPDGEIRFVRSIAEAIRNAEGIPVRTVGATQDITDYISARQSLLESEEGLRSAGRLAHVGYWHRDLRTNRVTWSEECFRIFGQPRDDTPGNEQSLPPVVPQDRERVACWSRECPAGEAKNTIEFRIARPDGEVRTVRSVAEVLRDAEGTPVRLFGALHDITEERRAQQESFARQKLESVGTLASGIAHDFNNLLGSVLAHADLAVSELSAGLMAQDELKAIRQVALRGSEIVRQLMIYAGKESVALELVDLSRTVREMLELLKVSVSKHVTLRVQLDQDLPGVRANEAELRRIVMNLVTNASEAIGDRDGVISVNTSRVKAGAGADDRFVQLEISDTGCGMAPETQAKVFDPFFTTKSAGHGLGLAIVDALVRKLGGAIQVSSEVGRGTTLRILLPAAHEASDGTTDTPSRIEAPAGWCEGASVLIVEDESALRQAVAKMLRRSGFDVYEAADGATAIELLHAKGARMDAILLDMTIPGASSHEVLSEAVRARPDVRVLLTSAYSQQMIAGAIRAPQVRGFLRKPFALGDLVKALRNVLSSETKATASNA